MNSEEFEEGRYNEVKYQVKRANTHTFVWEGRTVTEADESRR